MVQLTDETGNVIKTYEYDSFGNDYVSTVGNVNEETVRKYIQEQEENDKLEDGRK